VRPLLRIAAFELRTQLGRASTWLLFALFALVFFVVAAGNGGAFGAADTGQAVILVNSPVGIARTLLTASMLGVIVTAGFAGAAVYRDFQTGAYPLFFTTPVRPAAYLAGRWLGAVGANFVVLLGAAVGMLAATVWPGVDPGRMGPFAAGDYLRPLLLLVLPNLMFCAALFIVVAALTRRMLPTYVAGMGLLVCWGTAQVFAGAIDADWTVVLLDPFGITALARATRYWTVVEQNGAAVPFGGGLGWNRALWLGVGAGVLALGMAGFRFAHAPGRPRSPGAGAREAEPDAPPGPLHVPAAPRSFGARSRLLQLAAETRRAVREVVASAWFWVLVGLCLFFVFASGSQVGVIYGTTTYPVTYQVAELVGGVFALFVVIIIVVYAGELVWNERERRAEGIYDALPLPTWVPVAARLLALVAVVAALQAAAMLSGMVIQAAHGYFRHEPGVYLRALFVHGLLGDYLPFVVLAVLVHTLVNQKYVGHVLVVVFYVGMALLYFVARVEHNLLMYGSTPSLVYSDMNGFGHALGSWRWFAAYWGGVALLLAIASNLFTVRGQETGVRGRLRLARLRLRRPLLAAAAGAVALVLGTGGFIFYNTTALNDFESSRHGQAETARYEKLYKRFEWAPQPRVTAATLNVQLYPRARAMRVRGSYRLVNRTAVSIDSLHVDWPATLHLRALALDRPAVRVVADSAVGYYVLRLGRPLAPGDSALLSFDLEHRPRGFPNEPEYGPVLWNGTFLDSGSLPHVGYNPEGELTDEGARERHGLRERPRALPRDGARGRSRNFVSRDADWIRFDVTVGTEGDQTALAPGYLQREWRQGGRRYFRYLMDAPILNFYAVLSGRYRVRRERWRGVSIEVYHHPGHEYNVERMIRSVQASLAYYTREFGPYQHRQVRIVEFPRYGAFAQSFDNTIPYSEGIGFIADVGRDDIDYPYFVTAHEVAHQWWGHQVAPADVQGGAMLSETLAEYSALMVMEERYGREHIGRFLRHELDAYLIGRGQERRAELPLVLVENQQYIHYNKGALAMYALRDYIGERRLNGALRGFLEEWRFRGPPYPTSRDLVRHLRAATPDSLRQVVSDLFEHVTLHDNVAAGATARPLPGGRWQVELQVEALKAQADDLGNEEYLPTDDWIDVGVYTAGEAEPIYLRKHHFTEPSSTVRVVVDRRPARAGIDPLHKLIDRELDDNVVAVSLSTAAARSDSAPRRRR